MNNPRAIRIQKTGPKNWDWSVILGGRDVSDYVTDIIVHISARGLPVVVLHCQADIELPEEMEALVEVERNASSDDSPESGDNRG